MVNQKWAKPNFVFSMRPNIFGNQWYTPANIPKMADMPITMWKCATTK